MPTARIVILISPAEEPGHIAVGIRSEWPDGTEFTIDEIIRALEPTLQGLRDGTIQPTGRHRRDDN